MLFRSRYASRRLPEGAEDERMRKRSSVGRRWIPVVAEKVESIEARWRRRGNVENRPADRKFVSPFDLVESSLKRSRRRRQRKQMYSVESSKCTSFKRVRGTTSAAANASPASCRVASEPILLAPLPRAPRSDRRVIVVKDEGAGLFDTMSASAREGRSARTSPRGGRRTVGDGDERD